MTFLSKAPPTVRSAATLLVVSALLNALGARALDAAGLIEGILSPSGARILILVPVTTLFFTARLYCYFVAPGLLLGAALDAARLRWLPHGSADRETGDGMAGSAALDG